MPFAENNVPTWSQDKAVRGNRSPAFIRLLREGPVCDAFGLPGH